MPRTARKESESNFYHVMVQGINKEYIFNTDSNIKKYKEFILKKLDRGKIEVLAYCIMNNHVHLLIYCEKIEYLSKFMQKLNTSYSRFYNKINKRVGYVFRDRYLSQSILDEKQLYNCVNYIHNNPLEAGIVNDIRKYKYSSYNEFFGEKEIITDKGIKLLFGSKRNYKEQLMQIKEKNNYMQFIDVKKEEKDIYEFIIEIEEKYQKKINEIKEDKNLLKTVIKEARKETNVTIVELAEILKISKSSVGKYIKK